MLRPVILVLTLSLALPALAESWYGYVYSPIGKRDPFRSYTLPTDRPSPPPWCGELCRYALSELRLVAIIWGTAKPRALLETPDGRGHIVTRRQPVGRYGGRVAQIDKRGVVIAEEYRDGLGRKVVTRTRVPLWTKEATAAH